MPIAGCAPEVYIYKVGLVHNVVFLSILWAVTDYWTYCGFSILVIVILNMFCRPSEFCLFCLSVATLPEIIIHSFIHYYLSLYVVPNTVQAPAGAFTVFW